MRGAAAKANAAASALSAEGALLLKEAEALLIKQRSWDHRKEAEEHARQRALQQDRDRAAAAAAARARGSR